MSGRTAQDERRGSTRRRCAVGGAVLLLLAAAAAALPGAPIVPRHDRDEAAYRALAERYPAVGRLAHGGSATLIAPRFALTAAHCVMFSTAIEFEVGSRTVAVTRWFWHPEALPGDHQIDAGKDVALLELAEAVTAVAPIPLTAIDPAGDEERGREATLVGFGMGGDGRRGAVEPLGRKRAARNLVDAIGGDFAGVTWGREVLLLDFDAPGPLADGSAAPNRLGDAAPLELEGGLATGDSGGALLLDESGDGSDAELIGVLSGVSGDRLHVKSGGPENRYGVLNRVLRVAAFRDWIEHVMRAVERGTGGEERPVLTWRAEARDGGGDCLVIERSGDLRWPLALRFAREGTLVLRGLIADPQDPGDAELIDPASGMALLDFALLPAGRREVRLELRPLREAADRELRLVPLPSPLYIAPPAALTLRARS